MKCLTSRGNSTRKRKGFRNGGGAGVMVKKFKRLVIDDKRKLQLRPVVALDRIDAPEGRKKVSKASDLNARKTVLDKKCRMKSVVVLENILDTVTETGAVKKINGKSNTENKKDIQERGEPVVLLVDCLQDMHLNGALKRRQKQQLSKEKNGLSSSKTKREEKGQAAYLKQRGLKDFKLSQVKIEPRKLGISVKIITQLLVDAVSLGNAPSRPNPPFDLENPAEEFHAIVEALLIYADRVTPKDSIYLFHNSNHHPIQNTVKAPTVKVENNGTENYQLIQSLDRMWPRQEMMFRRREPKKKGWLYVSTLGSSDFFFKIKFTLGGRGEFEKKMVSVMKAGLTVDPYNWTCSEVGYILGFWLAKLYNAQGIPDEKLPRELVQAKEHFLELHGLIYDSATVTK